MASGAVSLKNDQIDDLLAYGQLYQAGNETFPASANDLPNWLMQRQEQTKVSITGGDYWLYFELKNDTNTTDWVFNPHGTLIERVDLRLYRPDGTYEQVTTGYRADHDYSLHYGKSIHLNPGETGKVLIRFESTYYASEPHIGFSREADYEKTVLYDNALTFGALGALLTLAIYNLFIFLITHDRALFYYSAYLIAYFSGWAFTFHIFSELLGWRNLHLHYIPFFLLPVLNTLFYMEFLQLKEHFPRLAAISRINYILPLILLPSCFFAISYAHALATIVITLWLVLGLVCGIASMRSGFQPARYFVVAFISIIIPGAIILPANVGLIPDLVDNSELLTLLGGTCDAILLAFALAYKIRLLAIEKEHALHQKNQMLTIAHTDHLTRIANRHAFNEDFSATYQYTDDKNDPTQTILFLIDLDGLKRINDLYGHARGDELLYTFAHDLAKLNSEETSVYRLGGDEFTILTRKKHEEELRSAMDRLEAQLTQRGFDSVGISYGISVASECVTPNEMLARADQRMYEYKAERRRIRADNGLDPAPQQA